MSTIPKKVSDAFEELKKKYDIYLELKKINGHFYIYHATSEWDAEKKKTRKITEYLLVRSPLTDNSGKKDNENAKSNHTEKFLNMGTSLLLTL